MAIDLPYRRLLRQSPGRESGSPMGVCESLATNSGALVLRDNRREAGRVRPSKAASLSGSASLRGRLVAHARSVVRIVGYGAWKWVICLI
jgi:hypothetical protein